MEKLSTDKLIWSVLREHLKDVPGELVVWKEGATEYTAAEMYALVSLSELSGLASDVLARWYSNLTYTSLLRYRHNESL